MDGHKIPSQQRNRVTVAFLVTCLVLPLFLFMAVSPTLAAEGQPQVFYLTPTPDDRGRVIYIVQAGDSCTSISLKNNVSIEDLRLLNNISGEECTVFEGQELLLAIVEEPTAMAITPTPTSLFPTPTPFAGFVSICIRLFEDLNGNAIREETEFLMADGAVSITDRLGQETWTGRTVFNEELCFDELPAGEYNISIAIPGGYNNTTISSQLVNVNPGDIALVNFGAQSAGVVIGDEPVESENGGSSPLLAIIGGVMLLAGGGLGLYMAVFNRGKDRF
jgi:LysM repeat protein